MSGLQRILRLNGSMTIIGKNGKKAVWVWDYANHTARLKSEMTRAEISASAKAKKQLEK